MGATIIYRQRIPRVCGPLARSSIPFATRYGPQSIRVIVAAHRAPQHRHSIGGKIPDLAGRSVRPDAPRVEDNVAGGRGGPAHAGYETAG